jgi:predicted lipoprotein with Yx(FWY)xxD motif
MRIVTMLLGATAAIGTLAACGSGEAQEATNPPAASGAVSVKDQTLVDSAGKTLYFADQEADGTIKCTESCLAFWFPVEGTESTAKSMEGLAVVKRSDNGMSQLTFQGKPLYTFKLDTGPGQNKGNNLTDEFDGTTFVWRAATTAAAPTQAPPSSGDDYGY